MRCRRLDPAPAPAGFIEYRGSPRPRGSAGRARPAGRGDPGLGAPAPSRKGPRSSSARTGRTIRAAAGDEPPYALMTDEAATEGAWRPRRWCRCRGTDRAPRRPGGRTSATGTRCSRDLGLLGRIRLLCSRSSVFSRSGAGAERDSPVRAGAHAALVQRLHRLVVEVYHISDRSDLAALRSASCALVKRFTAEVRHRV